MSKKAVVILAEGFEEMEAVIPIDILRRANIDVLAASAADKLLVCGSRKIIIQADVLLKDIINEVPDILLLPGGSQGAINLSHSEMVIDFVRRCAAEDKIIAAICAAPAYVLTKAGVLSLKKATCYPGSEIRFSKDTVYVNKKTVIDGNIITGQGPGAAFAFALAIVEKVYGQSRAKEVKDKALITGG
ncbi:MAG: DJ-1/PfpI family protein [Candidatus Omnitrophica bacterium]|nr:DJ-1/PfpI family protein [Candidatus Omnitrophota bacterium]